VFWRPGVFIILSYNGGESTLSLLLGEGWMGLGSGEQG
jgi:hypothetical protein